MEDSFFGYDTSIPFDEDGGGQIEEPSEEDYDALNDETFGSAINADWEEAHEKMVRLDDNVGDGSFVVQRGKLLHNSRNMTIDDKLIDYSNNSSRASTSPALLRLTQPKFSTADSDLELNLANMKLEEVDFRFNDNTHSGLDLGGLIMDPNVWSTNPMQATSNLYNFGNNNSVMFSGHANGLPMSNMKHMLDDSFAHKSMQQMQQPPTQQSLGLPKLPVSSKICTLEDIERNIILSQTIQKQQQPTPNATTPLHKLDKLKALGSLLDAAHSPPRPPSSSMNLPTLPLQQQQTPPHALLQQQPQHPQQLASSLHLPPGFPPLYPQVFPQKLPPVGPLLAQHNLPLNFQHPLQRPQIPIALNNFAMHPTFSAMRATAAAPNATPQQQQQQQQQINLLNMRMMQEIQQNHPMLQQQRPLLQQMPQHPHLPHPHNHHLLQPQYPHPMHQHHYQQQQQQELQRHNLMKQQQQQHMQLQPHRQHQTHMNNNHNTNRSNGNFPHREFDEYANLMSIRDKHWLIGIQLSQLNVDTPYIDDYYYSVYKERLSELKGEMRNSQAHKDNQLNHPLIQPRGHTQLILVQLGNKNGTRNGQQQQQQRERRNSDVNTQNNNNHNNNHNHNHNQNHNNYNQNNSNREQQDKSSYVYTPMKFENSLGKLQYGSVTAPRKIIDADVMSTENAQLSNGAVIVRPKTPAVTSLGAANFMLAGSSGGGNNTLALIQHKTRDLLLHIETLYRIVLKLEDLKNPAALQSIALKKKKDAERVAAMEQQENAYKSVEEIAATVAIAAAIAAGDESVQAKPKNYYEIEPENELLESLLSGLTIDKVIAMMNVRKGKILLRRALPFIKDETMRWNLWIGIFQALQTVVKKDREDNEGTLYALYPEFKQQIGMADFHTVLRFAHALSLNNKKSDGIFCSRFGISALVCLIRRAEQIYQSANTNIILDINHMKKWPEFLNQMATSLSRTIQNQTICAAIETDSIQPLINHVKRFQDLKLDALLALIDKAKKQLK